MHVIEILEREHRVIGVHPHAVIAHANERAPTVLDVDVEYARASVEGVFHELLDG